MEKIKKLRQEIGMSQKALSEKISIHKTTYSQIENGKLIISNKEQIKEMAVEILYPILMKKLLSAREEVDRLENMSIQFKPKKK